MKTLNQSPTALKYLTHYYREYLVDLSVNEVSVHMNGHSEQKLGNIYNQASQIIL